MYHEEDKKSSPIPIKGQSNARGTRLLHSPANTFSFIGPRYFGFKRLHLKALKKLTWPNERGSVGRRVQKASAPSTALKGKCQV
ncbi:hypothetical protein SLEP1_g21187 [Rubroshorea leprosula]|uniref:Ribosomal protein L32 n=1 Tax=Rubroshorea leprosula TaxID=152421 RepID=A0AAV5JFP2_9ROSI|nr:hypothetical protein SLEP1_g21187 [Rubroshorea leprosula]